MAFYGIVRDKNGKPRFDDPANVPEGMKAMLTDKDLLLLEEDVVEQLGMTPRLRQIKEN